MKFLPCLLGEERAWMRADLVSENLCCFNFAPFLGAMVFKIGQKSSTVILEVFHKLRGLLLVLM